MFPDTPVVLLPIVYLTLVLSTYNMYIWNEQSCFQSSVHYVVCVYSITMFKIVTMKKEIKN